MSSCNGGMLMTDKKEIMGKQLKILEIDPWVAPFEGDLRLRQQRYESEKKELLKEAKDFYHFSNGHHFFGFHPSENGWIYREWAPGADALFLIGDFNQWNRLSHPLKKKEHGVWELWLPGREALTHQSLVKVHVVSQGIGKDRIPLYIRRVVQNEKNHDFTGQIWDPKESFRWTDQSFQVDWKQAPFIYETHIGMAQEKQGIGTYREFEENILPRIKEQGYNTIQIMAIMQHPYYASFGYHVSNYFAASSWFGNPEELKSLINTAHEMGMAVLMDVVQSHAVKNTLEGINEFDGTVHQFFHSGSRGTHSAWDSKLFNYGKQEVIHFLLSSLKFWMEEYHFDGFRFDGVTSMIYHDHGLGTAFDRYEKYFSSNTDVEALNYLQFANELIKEIREDGVSIAEDMSGMPGMCLPIKDGGIGFDYRLAMGMPDFWVKTLKKRDEEWDMHAMFHELSTSRPKEKRIGYVESHDQALVGDKTFIFHLADKAMYEYMNKESQSLVIDRAMALHKMARLITISMGSDGYLNFMGNEFGHPEWIDFPREGNGWSFAFCRRQWSLVENPFLRYEELNAFDQAMLKLMQNENLMGGENPKCLLIDTKRKVIAYKKKGFLFLYNFHPLESLEAFEIPTYEDGRFQVVMDTDEKKFGGHQRIQSEMIYRAQELKAYPKDRGITIYLPNRTGMVLKAL